MAKRKKNVEDQVVDAVKDYLNQSFNELVQNIANDLPGVSPVDTGFFASSWKAGTQKPQAVEKVEEEAPWSILKKSRDASGNQYVSTSQKRLNAVIRPRHKVPSFRYTQKVFIGNTVEYAVYALESGEIQQYVQGYQLKARFEEAFKGRRRGAVQVAGRGLIGAYSGRQYIDYDKI